MVRKKRKPTRREFLELGVGAVAGGLLLKGTGCSGSESNNSDAGTDAGTDAGVYECASPDSRDDCLLFSPGSIGKLQLKNRLVRSATMESLTYTGEVNEPYLELYRNLAAGGVGTIISGMLPPYEPDAMLVQIYIYDDQHIEQLTTVAEAVHAADSQCKLVAQICHSGHRVFGQTRVGPTDIGWPADTKETRALSVSEIHEIIDAFAQAIRRVKEAGWDGAQLHGAHAYLLSSFLSPYTNRRTDSYGGSVQNRVRIISEIVSNARAMVGDDFPIFIKVNSSDSGGGNGEMPDGITKDNFPELATELVNAGLDALEISGNACLTPDVDEPAEMSYFLPNLENVDVDVPLILTGGNRTVELLEEIMQGGQVDFIGLARPLIREPDLPNRWLNKQGASLAACISCNDCMNNIATGVRCHQVK